MRFLSAQEVEKLLSMSAEEFALLNRDLIMMLIFNVPEIVTKLPEDDEFCWSIAVVLRPSLLKIAPSCVRQAILPILLMFQPERILDLDVESMDPDDYLELAFNCISRNLKLLDSFPEFTYANILKDQQVDKSNNSFVLAVNTIKSKISHWPPITSGASKTCSICIETASYLVEGYCNPLHEPICLYCYEKLNSCPYCRNPL